jgi:hypothetical protein
VIATRAAMATGSGVQLARAVTDWAIMRHNNAKTGRWSRFETNIAACAAMLRPQSVLTGSPRKNKA